MRRLTILLVLTSTLAAAPAAAAADGLAAAGAPGEVIVGYERSATPGERRAARVAVDGAIERSLPLGRTVHVLDVDGDAAAAARAIAARDGVAWAEPNRRVDAARTPDDPRWPDLWGLAAIRAPLAWDRTTGAAGPVVAVVDTGVAMQHPDLAGAQWVNPADPVDGDDDDGNGLVDDAHGWDWVDDDRHPVDLDGHGTHVAGTIAARGDDGLGVAGVTWRASIMPLRVLGPDGGTLADVAAGFAYAASHGAHVVNASLGAAGTSSTLTAAVEAAPQTLFVVAAGNGGGDGIGDDLAGSPQTPCTITAPNLICIAATQPDGALAPYSNRSATFAHVAAPGSSVLSTLPTLADRFSDDLESAPDRFSAGGAGTAWARTAGTLQDTPGSSYVPGSDTWAQYDGLDLGGAAGCRLHFWLALDVDSTGDRLRIEAATSPSGPFTTVAGWTGRGSANLTAPLDAYAGQGSVSLRVRLVTDATGTGQGATLDDLRVRCAVTDGGGRWAYFSGTSMATPHVAGAAALLWGALPAATVADVRAALLDGAVAQSALTGLVATGARLDLPGALHELLGPPPETTLAAGSTGVTFTASIPGSTFACRIDGGSWAACSSPYRLPAPAPGEHVLAVRATSPTGMVEPEPAEHRWTVSEPVAPDTPAQDTPPEEETEAGAGEQEQPPVVTVPRRQRRAIALRRGIAVLVRCRQACSTGVSVSARGGRRAGLLPMRAFEPGHRWLYVRLAAPQRRALRRGATVVLTVRAAAFAAAGAAQRTVRVTVR